LRNAVGDGVARPVAAPPGDGGLSDKTLLKALRAVRRGDFSVRLPEDGTGVPNEIAEAFNGIVELNQRMSRELRRVSRVVGREGRIRQRASLGATEGEWASTLESVNELISALAEPMIEVTRVVEAVARGDLTQRVAVEIDGRPLKGEFRHSTETINTMVDQLNAFAGEVTRVAREVGTEGKLGGQAEVRGVEGTWKDLTDNVNQLAANLTTQVRNIAEVATAVTRGDLSRSIQVEASGEVELLRNDLNEMIRNLRDTTRRNREQDWLNINVARFAQRLQGQRDMQTVAQLTLSELARLVNVQRGAAYLCDNRGPEPTLTLLASYAHEPGAGPPAELRVGEGLIGQCVLERRRILLEDVPSGYVTINSALGSGRPLSLVILPVLFENETLAVLELASLSRFSEIQLAFLEQVTVTLGVVINTIAANRRTEQLVQEQAGRVEAEAGLARLRQVVDVMPEGILIADAAGTVYLSNAAAVDVMGHVPSSILPGSDELPKVLRLDGSSCRPEDQPLARTVLRGEVVRGEQLIITNSATGREVPILVNSAPLSDAQGIPAGGVAVFQDITPLRDLDRQMDEFLAAVSHDLKTPATIIKGRANLLQRGLGAAGLAAGEHVADGLAAIDEATAQLVRLVDELLDLTRMRMGQPVQLELGPTNLVSIAASLAREYQNMSPRHVIRVEADNRRLLGDWDQSRIERVIANLVSNAVKYSPRGGEIDIRISPEQRDGEEWAILVVEDNGVGIPPEDMERVFEPYYRGSNVDASISGSGVGLAGTRHIVEQHGGEISVNSIVGQGTTFKVCLPLSRERVELVDA
jgi:PAS domain S-box-containing protein